MTIALDIQNDPEQAINNINAHDHTGGLGNQISENGLQDGAVGMAKIKDRAVTGAKIAPLTITKENIADGTITSAKLSSDAVTSLGGGGGLLGITKFIGNGLKLAASATDLSLTVLPGRASITEKNHELKTPVDVSLLPNQAALLYAQYSGFGDVPIIGKTEARYPALENDHLVRYCFNQKENDTTILDTSVNKNDLTINGGCTLVDGWADKAIRVDGTTGYLVSTTSDNFPTGTAVRSITLIITVNAFNTTRQNLFSLGSNATNQMVCVGINPDGKLFIDHYNTTTVSLFALEQGKTYQLTYTYDGSIPRLYVNGYLVFQMAPVTVNVGTGYKLHIGKGFWTTADMSFCTYHYFDMRNTLLAPEKIGRLANQALFPCSYQTTAAQYPVINHSEYHEYKFDETTENKVTDSGVTTVPLHGTAGLGAVIVPSSLGLGNARSFNGAAGASIELSSTQVTPNGFTMVAVFNPKDTAAYRSIFGNRASAAGAGGVSWAVENVSGPARMRLYDNGNKVDNWSSGRIYPEKPNFAAVVIENGYITHYINSPDPDVTAKGNIGSGGYAVMPASFIGKVGVADGEFFNGTIEYFLIVPDKALTKTEIAQIYNALMATRTVSFTDDAIPVDAIALGFLRTNSSQVLEVDDISFKYGRNETPFRNGGNKRVFLGWRWVTANQIITVPHPLGTRAIKVDIVGRKSMSDELWLNTNMDAIYSSGTYGSLLRGTNPFYFRFFTGETTPWWGENSYDDLNGNSWIGFYVELL